MSRASTPATVAEAQARIAQGHADAADIPRKHIEDARRLRRDTMVIVAARKFKADYAETMEALYRSERITSDIERSAERLIQSAHLHEVYDRARVAVEEKRLDDYLASVERQLYHATAGVRVANSLVGSLSRTYYIAARAQLLKECEPEEVDRLTGLESR